MDRGELGTFLFTAERFDHSHAALAVLLGLNGLRVSEACGTNVEDLGFQRGHRTLRILGKGNKPALIPLVPRAARTIDLAVGERHEGPIICRHDGQRLDRRTASPLGAIHRQASRVGLRAPTHVARRVHHGGPRCRSPSTRRADRRPSRRSPHDDHLRPPSRELRPPRSVRRSRLRRRQLTGTGCVPYRHFGVSAARRGRCAFWVSRPDSSCIPIRRSVALAGRQHSRASGPKSAPLSRR